MSNFPILQGFTETQNAAIARGWPKPATHWITSVDVKPLAKELQHRGGLPPTLSSSADPECSSIQRVIRAGHLVYDGAAIRVAHCEVA